MNVRTRQARGERGLVVPPPTPKRRRQRPEDSAWKSGATRLGIPYETYRAHVQAGEKWCSGCQSWHTASLTVFPRDRARIDGFRGTCRAWCAQRYQSRRSS